RSHLRGESCNIGARCFVRAAPTRRRLPEEAGAALAAARRDGVGDLCGRRPGRRHRRGGVRRRDNPNLRRRGRRRRLGHGRRRGRRRRRGHFFLGREDLLDRRRDALEDRRARRRLGLGRGRRRDVLDVSRVVDAHAVLGALTHGLGLALGGGGHGADLRCGAFCLRPSCVLAAPCGFRAVAYFFRWAVLTGGACAGRRRSSQRRGSAAKKAARRGPRSPAARLRCSAAAAFLGAHASARGAESCCGAREQRGTLLKGQSTQRCTSARW
ncbi:unnamed protein product, partial [Pelagomonas calceolata]